VTQTGTFLQRTLLCAAIGIVVELAAYAFGLYYFEPEWLVILVVIGAFGLILGIAAQLTRNRGVALQGLAGAAVGVLLELMNVHVAQFWRFGDLIGRVLPDPTVRAILLGSVGATVPILVNALLRRGRTA
jgi:hypothetical protein